MRPTQVLIVARNVAAASKLGEDLAALGWPCALAAGRHEAKAMLATGEFKAAIVYLNGLGGALDLATPTIAVADHSGLNTPSNADLLLAGPVHPLQVATQLQALTRTALTRGEFARRQDTFAEAGMQLPTLPPDDSPLRILTVAEPAPPVLALTNALAEAGAQVTNALTTYTAFDYLQQGRFDAVAMWTGAGRQEALSIASGLRRNTRLFHIPVYLQQSEDAVVAPQDAYRRGVSDLAAPNTTEAEAAWRILALARAFRVQTNVYNALTQPAIGHFPPPLFATHLARLASDERCLSVCVLKVALGPQAATARAGGWLEAALSEVGTMIQRLARVYDTSSRLAPDVFALALPDTDLAGARAVAARITTVVNCTGFTSTPGAAPLMLSLAAGIAEVATPAGVGAALETAAAQADAELAGAEGAISPGA